MTFYSLAAKRLCMKAKHLLDQMIERNPLMRSRKAQRFDRMGNPIGDGSYHSRYDVFDIPNTHTRVSPSLGTESVYVSYCKDGDEYCLEPIKVRYSHHDDNATRFGEVIDGRYSRKNVLDEILYKMGVAKPVFEEYTRHIKSPITSKVTNYSRYGFDKAKDIPRISELLGERKYLDESDIGKLYRSSKGVKVLDGFNEYNVTTKKFKGFEIPEELKYLYDMEFNPVDEQ